MLDSLAIGIAKVVGPLFSELQLGPVTDALFHAPNQEGPKHLACHHGA